MSKKKDPIWAFFFSCLNTLRGLMDSLWFSFNKNGQENLKLKLYFNEFYLKKNYDI